MRLLFGRAVCARRSSADRADGRVRGLGLQLHRGRSRDRPASAAALHHLRVAGLVVNVGLNLWLIPIYGFMAAAWVCLAHRVVVIGLALHARAEADRPPSAPRPDHSHRRSCRRPAASPRLRRGKRGWRSCRSEPSGWSRRSPAGPCSAPGQWPSCERSRRGDAAADNRLRRVGSVRRQPWTVTWLAVACRPRWRPLVGGS